VLTYANAGHYPPILVRADGSVDRLASGGPVMGVFPDAAYEQSAVPAGSGDRLILFTDGITEVQEAGTDENGPEFMDFGEERLIALATEHRACSAPALHARLTSAVAAFAGGEFQDDATLIVLAVE
jgi:phosphoserine phosphatase RsbU/P